MSRFTIEAMSQVRVEPQEIIDLVSEMNKLHEDGVDVSLFSQIGILAEKYPHGSDKPFIIMERMQCLVALMEDDRMRGWTLDGIEPGCKLTSSAVFQATANSPLHGDDHRVWFEPDEFFAAALSVTPADGHA